MTKEKLILAEIDNSLVFKALLNDGLLTPGTPVTFKDNLVKIGNFEFKAQASRSLGPNVVYDAEAAAFLTHNDDQKSLGIPPEAIKATVNEIHQLQPVFK